MIVIPAIDLSQGHCVRLMRGDMRRKTIYFPDPAQVAVRWAEEGAQLIHVVDLDGAVSGRRVNAEALAAICAATNVPIEVGGGLRTLDDIGEVVSLGARYVILGTVALRDPALLDNALNEYGEAIVVGIDARAGRVSVEGWTQDTSVSAIDLAQRVQRQGVRRIIFTDIASDGVLTGPNLEATRELAQAVQIEITASGGIASLDDIRALAALEPLGVTSCIVGRALYEGRFDLSSALRAARGEI